MTLQKRACPSSAGTLVNLLPAAFPSNLGAPKNMNRSIPVYQAGGTLYACVSEPRLSTLLSAGLVARVVRHRKGSYQSSNSFHASWRPEADVGQPREGN